MQIKYIKSSATPVLHADGMVGGPTPQNLLHVAFYSEHAIIPDSVTYRVERLNATQIRLQSPEQPARPTEIVRDVGAEVIMSLEVARSFRQWLDDQIKTIEQARPEDSLSQTEEQRSCRC